MKSADQSVEWEAIILAGGLGTRLRSAVANVPKPLAPMGGRPFLEYLLEYWLGQGVKRFIFSVAYKHELIQSHFGYVWRGAEIDYAVDEGWGTGGGLLNALSKIKSKENPFLVVNGDTYFEVCLKDFFEFHRTHSAQASLALFESSNAPGGRVTIDAGKKVSSFDSLSPKGGLVNGGVYIFETDYFSKYTEKKCFSLEKDFLAIEKWRGKDCYGFQSTGHFRDIGTPESYQSCAELFSLKKIISNK